MANNEKDLDTFLTGYRVITTAKESVDLTTDNLLKTINISVEQKRRTPIGFFTRGLIPYFAPLDNKNLFSNSMTATGISAEYASFRSGITYFNALGMQMFYNMEEVRDAEHGTIGYAPGASNMYGAFKVMFDRYQFVSEYPVFYSITAGNDPYAISSFTGVTEKGASGGCYTMVNFGGVITPFQLMINADTIGISNSNGLPTGTGGSPLYFGLSQYTGITSAVKSMYFTPNIHASLRRNILLYKDRGITFVGILASFNPYYEFIKFADDAYLDTQSNLMSKYVGNSANPAWTVELLRFAGATNGNNLVGFKLANEFNNRFLQEISQYPIKYNFTRDSYNIGHIGLPFVTEVLGWSAMIPTPGIAVDGTGPFASAGQNYFINRIAGLTLYPAPSGYTYSAGISGWNSYKKSVSANTNYYNDYFMLGNSHSAASITYAASNLIPANILTYFTDTGAGFGLDNASMSYLDSYYYDIIAESISYGGYRYANVYPINFTPRYNPLIPMQLTGSYSNKNFESRRDCTIHKDFGNSSAERLYNLKKSMADSLHAATKVWKLTLDQYGKYNYRIMAVLKGRNEDYDLTRGGSVPYTPSDFVEYLITPMFTGDVPVNAFVMNDDIDERLLNDFYYGNIARGSEEYTKVITNKGISGSDEATSFIRGLETYFFDLQRMQDQMSFSSHLADLGLTAAVSSHSQYMSNFNSGRLSDYRVFETNTGTTGGNTIIPYGKTGEFQWNLISPRAGSILYTDSDLQMRWGSTANNNIGIAYTILKDAYFRLTKQQLEAAYQYFEDSDITTFVQYRSTDKAIGR